MGFMEKIKEQIKTSGKKVKIVYPNGDQDACIEAVSILGKAGLITPILLGDPDAIRAAAKQKGFDLSGVEIQNPLTSVSEDFISTYVELRKSKGMTAEKASEILKESHYFGAMLVEKGLASGMVSGLTSDTKPFIPAFQIIRTKPGISRASAVFFMVKGDDVKLYADCAMNIDPDVQTLASIGAATGDTATAFGIPSNIAFLSFSTRGSAEGPLVEKVANAVKTCKTLRPKYNIDGEMQFDAALLSDVAKKKCPDSPVGGKATIYVFPDLNAGNIAYKITERLGGYKAIGPIFQGLNKPVNDLSRGAKPEDIADTGYITALQALMG